MYKGSGKHWKHCVFGQPRVVLCSLDPGKWGLGWEKRKEEVTDEARHICWENIMKCLNIILRRLKLSVIFLTLILLQLEVSLSCRSRKRKRKEWTEFVNNEGRVSMGVGRT